MEHDAQDEPADSTGTQESEHTLTPQAIGTDMSLQVQPDHALLANEPDSGDSVVSEPLEVVTH